MSLSEAGRDGPGSAEVRFVGGPQDGRSFGGEAARTLEGRAPSLPVMFGHASIASGGPIPDDVPTFEAMYASGKIVVTWSTYTLEFAGDGSLVYRHLVDPTGTAVDPVQGAGSRSRRSPDL